MHSRPYGAPRPVACEELKVYKGTSIEELKGLYNKYRILCHFLMILSTHYFLPLFPFLLLHCTVATFLVLPIFCFINPLIFVRAVLIGLTVGFISCIKYLSAVWAASLLHNFKSLC